jgi:hypothetical protein
MRGTFRYNLFMDKTPRVAERETDAHTERETNVNSPMSLTARSIIFRPVPLMPGNRHHSGSGHQSFEAQLLSEVGPKTPQHALFIYQSLEISKKIKVRSAAVIGDRLMSWMAAKGTICPGADPLLRRPGRTSGLATRRR